MVKTVLADHKFLFMSFCNKIKRGRPDDVARILIGFGLCNSENSAR